jgi:DNA-binding MarR family transcriptional regulator/transposase-like protein
VSDPGQAAASAQPRQYAPAFKVRVALAAIKGDRTRAQVATRFKVDAADVSRWRRQLVQHAGAAFAPAQDPASATRSASRRGRNEPAVQAAGARHSYVRSIVYWSRILGTLYNRQYVAALGPKHVPVSFWRILSWLAESGALTVGEIAAHSQIERTVLSRMLERMAAQGLIARVPRQGDRRVSETRITPKGRKAVRMIRPVRQRVYARATRGIESGDIDFACAIIIRMIDNLGGHTSIFPAEAVARAPVRRG